MEGCTVTAHIGFLSGSLTNKHGRSTSQIRNSDDPRVGATSACRTIVSALARDKKWWSNTRRGQVSSEEGRASMNRVISFSFSQTNFDRTEDITVD
jgi:hypothetical protein